MRTIVVGSGQALELARRGDVDVLLVHAPEAEERFVREGLAISRRVVMYNDFVLAGPAEDPAGVRGLTDATRALERIAAAGASFLSRGDSSGTHDREIQLWRRTGRVPAGDWYAESGQGQGTTLQVASERRSYVLTDRATLRQLRDAIDLEALVENDPALINVYSVLVPRATRHEQLARDLADWLVSGEAAHVIVDFNGDRGEVLFVPVSPGSAPALPLETPGPPDSSSIRAASSPGPAGERATSERPPPL